MCTVRIDILMQGVESFGEGDTNFVVGHNDDEYSNLLISILAYTLHGSKFAKAAHKFREPDTGLRVEIRTGKQSLSQGVWSYRTIQRRNIH